MIVIHLGDRCTHVTPAYDRCMKVFEHLFRLLLLFIVKNESAREYIRKKLPGGVRLHAKMEQNQLSASPGWSLKNTAVPKG